MGFLFLFLFLFSLFSFLFSLFSFSSLLDGLLAHVDPNDGSILGVLFTHLLDALFEALLGRLSTAVDFVARDPSEVGNAIDLVLQLLDLFEMVQHGSCLPYLGIFGVT